MKVIYILVVLTKGDVYKKKPIIPLLNVSQNIKYKIKLNLKLIKIYRNSIQIWKSWKKFIVKYKRNSQLFETMNLKVAESFFKLFSFFSNFHHL